jgi:tripartite ATP-independent transporter DctP family solute receptor
MTDYFKPYVEEKSGGRISVEVYCNSILGGDRQLYESLQFNTVQATFGPTSVLANFEPNYSIVDAPFLFKDKETAYAALDGEFGAMLAENLPNVGMRVLGYGENAFRNISNSVRPITKMEDMKGLKIRVMEAPVYIDTIKALGGNPTPMAFSELYTAIQQGTVDGQDNGVVLTYTSKVFEVVKYYTFTEHCYAANAYVFSEEFLRSLPDDLLQVLKDGTLYALTNQRRLNTEMEEELIKTIEASGVKVNRLSDEEKAVWMKATASVIDGLAGTVSPEILEAGKKINEVYGK